jgi:hypothetical protein
LRDDRHRSGRKTLAQRAKSGDLEVKRQATWGMSDEPDAGETALLGYRRGDVAAAVAEIVAQYG